ncbi:hypothetical protein BGZ58_007967 [Dissophora ornata]|nr:hypothetical protein BGZ58_007967 [Dissophora ornata]
MTIPLVRLQPKPLLASAFFIATFGFLQLYLYNNVPITIVTAASGNHACALEAFLYHINATFSHLSTSHKNDLRLKEDRIRRGKLYIETSRDLENIHKRIKNKPKAKSKEQKDGGSSAKEGESSRDEQQQEPQDLDMDLPSTDLAGMTVNKYGDIDAEDSGSVYEIRPKVIVYNMGMGPTKRKKRLFKALIEAGYIDEAIDLEFEKYPDFWQLGTETRGEYGWKAGIIEEVSQRLLAPSTVPSSLKRGIPRLSESDDDIRDWAAIKEKVDEDTSSKEDEEALDEAESETNQQQQEQLRVMQPPHESGIVLWLDSGDRISIGFLRWLPGFLNRHGLWTAQSQGTMRMWTHPGLLSYYNDSLDNFPEDETSCNGAAIAFDVRNSTVRDGILNEWVQCAKTKECIAPEGSSRENHRQDQAALTYLVKKMGYSDELCHGLPAVFGVQTNQDRYCKEDITKYQDRVVPSLRL